MPTSSLLVLELHFAKQAPPLSLAITLPQKRSYFSCKEKFIVLPKDFDSPGLKHVQSESERFHMISHNVRLVFLLVLKSSSLLIAKYCQTKTSCLVLSKRINNKYLFHHLFDKNIRSAIFRLYE